MILAHKVTYTQLKPIILDEVGKLLVTGSYYIVFIMFLQWSPN